MKIVLSEMLRNFRKEKGISQETLADYMGITVQAVSKWENNLSYPDIEFLPTLAEYYQVSIDYLLTGVCSTDNCNTFGYFNKSTVYPFPNDNVLRVAQFKGNQLLEHTAYDEKKTIVLKIPTDESIGRKIDLHIMGSAVIEGNINGNIIADNNVTCTAVVGNINADNNVTCTTVTGDIYADNNITSLDVLGNVSADNNIYCGNVSGNVHGGNNVTYTVSATNSQTDNN